MMVNDKSSDAEKCLSKTNFKAIADGIKSDENRWEEVRELLSLLYQIVGRLEIIFPGRKFTPDGHLVGSIGEVIAAYMFELKLLPSSFPNHDAEAMDGRKVQIKFTQGTSKVALRGKPEHLLVLRLSQNRTVEIVYNGGGKAAWDAAGKMQENGQRPISLSRLRNISVPSSEQLLQSHSINTIC